AHGGDVRPLGEAGGIAAAEEVLDVVRIVADEVACGHVLDHSGGDMGGEGGVVGFAIADDAGIGPQPDEDEIPAADAGRRVADDPGLDVDDLHEAKPFGTCRGLAVSGFTCRKSNKGLAVYDNVLFEGRSFMMRSHLPLQWLRTYETA